MKFTFLFCLSLQAMLISAITPAEAETALSTLHSQLNKVDKDGDGDSISQQMRQLFISVFEDPSTFDYPFTKLQFCKLTSSDHRIRLFNWNLPRKDGTHTYFCFVLVWDAQTKNYDWTELKDYQREVEKIENKFLTTDKWFGALYYEIIPMDKKGRGDTYTILGWDGKDRLTNRKIVDALTITNKKIRIGAGIYRSDDGTRKRMILEYSEDVSASVKYYAKQNCIVMDHLSPKNPMMTGIYADYGPDGSYDVLLLKGGKWELIENVNVDDFASGNEKPFYDPRPRRK